MSLTTLLFPVVELAATIDELTDCLIKRDVAN